MRLLNLIKNDKNNKQIVISHMLKGYSREDEYEGIKIYRYKYFAEIPFIVRRVSKTETVDVIHCHNLRPGFWGLVSNIFKKRPMILEMHSVYEVHGILKNVFRNIVLSKANCIIVISEESKKILVEEGIEEDCIKVLYNGIDLKKFSDITYNVTDAEINDYFEKNKENIIAGYIGSLREFQGIDNVIDIINKTDNCNVAFIVIGGEKEQINDIKKHIKNKRTLVHEFISQDEVASVYSQLDYLLMPRPIDKQTNSAVPLKPIEALASRCIVLSTASGGMLELKKVTKSEAIVICNVDKMIDILNDSKICKIEKENKIFSRLECFDVDRQRKYLLKLYEDVCERNDNEKNKKTW